MTTTQLIESVTAAYEEAAGQWVGCDWMTQHGSTNLDLDGESADDLRRYADLLEAGESAEVETVWDSIPKPDDIEEWVQLDARDPDFDESCFCEYHRQAWIEDLRSGADWLDDVVSAAASAESCAAEAMEHLSAGRLREAADCAQQASSFECDYGDDPVWGEFRKLVEKLVEKAADS